MRTAVIVIAVLLVLAALKAASSIVVPFLLAVMLALAFQPIAEVLTRRGLPPVVSAVVSILCVLAALVGMGALVVLAASDLATSAPRYSGELARTADQVVAWMQRHGLGALVEQMEPSDAGLDGGTLLRGAVVTASDVLGDLMNVCFLTAFIQLEATMFKQKLQLILAGDEPLDRVMEAIAETQRYLRVKMLLSLANGVLLGGWCALWGVSNPLLWGVLAFVLNFVPVIGSLLAAIPPVLLALVELGVGGALGVVAGYVAVNLVVDNMIEPRVMGRAMSLSPLVLMVSLLVWGYVLGPVGALLSVPLTVVVRIYLDYHPQTRWLALLLAAGTRGYQDLARARQG